MKKTHLFCVVVALLFLCPWTAAQNPTCEWVLDDPYKMHYPQLPDEAGWDVNATKPSVLADDWQCSETGWVKDFHFWGSWKGGVEGQILGFFLSVHPDIPVNPPQFPYSRPGPIIWERYITFDQVNAIMLTPPTPEGWYDPETGEIIPNDHQEYFQYNICLDSNDWFWQEQGTIYWFNISAVLEDPTSTHWGWKSSIHHWNDDAVDGNLVGVCVQPDDGTGTVPLPPSCPSTTTDETIDIVNGLQAGSTIKCDPILENYQNIVSGPGGSYGGESEQYDGELVLQMTGTGGLGGFSRLITIPVSIETHSGPRNPGDAVQSFPHHMIRINGDIFGDPDFDEIRIRGGSDFGLPSPGHTTLTRLGPPGSDFQVDSFFDIYYEIDFVGAPGSVLGGLSGTTQGTVRMRPGSTEGENWNELYEPDPFAGARINSFDISIDPNGNFLNGSGSDFYGDGWYYYPPEQWWNIWFYDHPYNPDRFKTIHIEFDAEIMDPSTMASLELAVNWSTAQWSIDQPPSDSMPPLPGTDEALYIGRATQLNSEMFGGHYVYDFTIPDFNPEWVSIDVRGFNFLISNGRITHECVSSEPPQSMDLSFVITGEPPTADEGACCLDDGSCVLATQTDCDAMGGTWLGPGTVCTAPEACCLSDGSCIDADPLCCELMGGMPQGPGTQCTAPEACCLSDGSCITADPLCCELMGGIPQGPGTQCTAPEACCLPDGSCEDIDPLCCLDRSGVPQGPGSLCDADFDGVDEACDPKTGACCLDDGSCISNISVNGCGAIGGTYMGDNTYCLGDNNANGIDDLCEDPWTPADDHKMHYPQLPDEAGWDVNASWPLVLADDWQCSETGWVKDIHFWGSWLNGETGNILDFVFSIHEDIPAGTQGQDYSRPGKLLWERRVRDYKATSIIPQTWEGYYDPYGHIILPDNHLEYFQYDVYLPEDLWFHQDSGTVYWLNITANVEFPTSPGRWGWKSSLQHFNDDAVWGYSISDPCTQPGNSTGTVDLPVDCPITQPNGPMVATEGLPEGTTLECNARVDSFFDVFVSAGGDLGGQILRFKADMTLHVTGTGALSTFDRTFSAPAEIEMHTGPQSPDKASQTIDIEILSMDLTGAIFGDPDFDLLEVRIGSVHELPSPGHTTITRLGPPGSNFNVDSFFDITYRIDFQGAPGGALSGMGGSTTGSQKMQQGGADVDAWTEMYEPPDFDVSLDLAFIITGDPGCDCMPGDANNDGTLNVGDAVFVINRVFKNGPAPAPYALCSGDANCDCSLNVGDAVYLINYVFKGGPPPCDCATWLSICGPPLRN
ncbi:MAG: hypothetical protein GY841_01215 [FCB group bacterium]|nr:hypothetical protein [FCB group bacterium]